MALKAAHETRISAVSFSMYSDGSKLQKKVSLEASKMKRSETFGFIDKEIVTIQNICITNYHGMFRSAVRQGKTEHCSAGFDAFRTVLMGIPHIVLNSYKKLSYFFSNSLIYACLKYFVSLLKNFKIWI